MDCNFSPEEFARYRVDLLYPEVTVAGPNPHWARLVSGIYAGQGSETTAIAQYTSHRYFTAQVPAAFTAYQYITIVETVHLQLLGNLMLGLGYRPVFASFEDDRWWSGQFPDYQYDLKTILASDIAGERGAIAHYQRLIGQIDDEDIQALFRRIILDEERHIEVLTGLQRAYANA